VEARVFEWDSDVITYNAAISACESWPPVDGSVDAITFKSAISACAESGVALLVSSGISGDSAALPLTTDIDSEQEGKHGGTCEDVITYNSAVSACEYSCLCIRVDPWGERDLGVDLLGVAPPLVNEDVDVITYKSAISACEDSGVSSLVKSGKSGDSAALPRNMAVNGDHGDAGVKEVDVITYKSAISACEDSGVSSHVISGRSGDSAALPRSSAVYGAQGEATDGDVDVITYKSTKQQIMEFCFGTCFAMITRQFSACEDSGATSLVISGRSGDSAALPRSSAVFRVPGVAADGDVDVITYKPAISACDESGVSLLVNSGRSGDSAALPLTSAGKGVHGHEVNEGKPILQSNEQSSGDVSEPCLVPDNVNFLDVIYEVVADLSIDADGNPVLGWIEIAHVVATARHAHGLSDEAVLEIIACWEEMEVMSVNPDKTMVKFVVPFFSPDCELSP